MDFFKINGKQIKPPKEISVSPEVLDKSERTADGTLVVDIIGTKRKVDLSWEYMSQEDMTILQAEIGGGAFSEIEFHDNAKGELVAITARSDGLTYMPHFDWVKARMMWKSVTLSFKER